VVYGSELSILLFFIELKNVFLLDGVSFEIGLKTTRVLFQPAIGNQKSAIVFISSRPAVRRIGCNL
jgi:hypothetical protein